ncbi:hypothetical protein PRZ48_008736 [Zasmidium cellare]|uniref:HMG box domain-containing protein n=1 Tax=Zasmidium cellare TaxID=395010 RepID=A0ABR0EGF9_ZASCE|nr:hypothetical protein PRZ48_008736 [Zasmidium cellare]
MASNATAADKAEAAERRKRKAEQLADNPRVQKVQKKIKIKQEPQDPSTEIAESVSDGVDDGQAEQNAASESDDEDGEDSSDSSGSDNDSESSSSSDTDAESSSESEDEEGEDATEPLEPSATVNPAGVESSPSNNSSRLPSDRLDVRMTTYFDVLANLDLSDPVAIAAVQSIASAIFDQVFPAAALELERQRASSSTQLRDRNVADDHATEILKTIFKALSPMVAGWQRDISKELSALRAALDAVVGEGRHQEKPNAASTEQRHEAVEQHTSSVEHPQPNPNQTEQAPPRDPEQTAPPPNAQRPPGYPFQVDESATPSVAPSVASNSHIPPTGHSASRETPSADRPGPIVDSFQLFGRHVQLAVRRSPDIPEKKIWGRARRVWERLLEAEREDWGDLYDQMPHHETAAKTIAATTEPAGFLIEKHQILDRIRRLDASSKTPTPRPKTPGPGKKGNKGKKVKTPKGPSGKKGHGSSRRSVDSYRPAR